MKPLSDLPKDIQELRNKIALMTTNLPKRIANIALKHFDESWTSQGFTDVNGSFKAWAERKKKEGVEADNRGILIGKGSGRLRRSLRVISTSANQVVIGTDVPYAQIHNEGGEINTTQSVRSFQKKSFQRTWKSRRQTVRSHTVKSFTRRLNIQMPQRQFMGASKPLIDKIMQKIDAEVKRIFEG